VSLDIEDMFRLFVIVVFIYSHFHEIMQLTFIINTQFI